MLALQLVIGIILITSVYYIFFKTFYNRIRVSKLSGDDLKFDNIRPIYIALKKGKKPKLKLINKYASTLEYRCLTYNLLHTFNKVELFPSDLNHIEAASKGYLAHWLNMNDDFDSLPEKIELKTKMSLPDKSTVIIFKFKTYEPHPYAYKGWMIGYVGYKNINSNAYIQPDIILSDFDTEVLSEQQLLNIMKK